MKMQKNKEPEMEDLCPDCRGLLVFREDVKIAQGNRLLDFAVIYICAKCKSRWIRYHRRNCIIRY
jgi:hypothetical protein